MRVAEAILSFVIFAGLCGCAKSTLFTAECAAIESDMAAAGGRTLQELKPTQTGSTMWEAEGSYEFDTSMPSSIAAARTHIPDRYRLIRQADGDLSYVHSTENKKFGKPSTC